MIILPIKQIYKLQTNEILANEQHPSKRGAERLDRSNLITVLGVSTDIGEAELFSALSFRILNQCTKSSRLRSKYPIRYAVESVRGVRQARPVPDMPTSQG